MMNLAHNRLIKKIRENAVILKDVGAVMDFSSLLKTIGDARFVLIGEATHGTEEFYRARAELTKQLIEFRGFSAVAVEGDWPDCYRANKYVRGDESIHNAPSALSEFMRFPSWMWRNEAVVEFLDWLREYNEEKVVPQDKAGFYGLDLYSLNASIESVVAYLDKTDPQAAERARQHYGCFDPVCLQNPQEYGLRTLTKQTRACEDDVVQQLIYLRHHAHDYMRRDGFAAGEDYFCAEQNAKVIIRAEEYYRAMFGSRISSWNLRDKHMMETLNSLIMHLSMQRSEEAKVVVWAHNSHIGDARATEMGDKGEWNLGQLVREQHGMENTRLIGFSTYNGTVTAASHWDGEAERKTVRDSMPESYEGLFHQTELNNFLLTLRGNDSLSEHLRLSRLQRTIGVIYAPETERQSHYYFSNLPEQFDAVIHFDTTSALKPLELTALWHRGEVFETYPTGL